MAPRWRTLEDGRRVPINDGSGSGRGIAVAVTVGMVLAVGGLSGGVAGTSAGTSATLRTVKAGKADAKRAAQSRNADQAWRRIGMRRLRQTDRRSPKCVRASFGRVREFLIHRPCTSLDQMLFAIADRQGNTVLVSVSWVRFRTKDRMRDFKRLIDVYGTGDFKPPAAGLLNMADIKFTARYYHSVARRSRLTVAETEPAKGTLDPETLDTIAEIAAHLPGPPTRRR